MHVSVSVCVCFWMHNNKLKRHSWVRAQKEPIPRELHREREKENERREEESERAQPAAEPPQHLIKYCSMGNCCCDCCLCLRQVKKKIKVKEALECTNNSRTTVQSSGEKNRNRKTEIYKNCTLFSSILIVKIVSLIISCTHAHSQKYIAHILHNMWDYKLNCLSA